MELGFGKTDITPRVGVELCGFGPFINRHSIGVRDRLWARAMAVRQDGTTVVVVSCDVVGLVPVTVREIRRLVRASTGLPDAAIMVHGTHTHSGPNTDPELIGWGVLDEPYFAALPARIARACIEAVAALRQATLAHAEVPCEGIALNREYDKDAPPLEEVLRDDWRPAKPELTDTTCHVLKAEADGKVIGFVSYYGCHPVVCCQATRYIHGDFVGVATNMIEREHPGSVGLFLQGAQGDVNSCVVHKPEPEALLALDVIAGRYANAVRAGLRQARALPPGPVRRVLRPAKFSHLQLSLDELRAKLAEQKAIFQSANPDDSDNQVRMAAVYACALGGLVARMEAGESLDRATELQGFRIGPVALLGTPFEVFQAIKNDAKAAARAPIPLVMGLTNDIFGYATDRATATRGGYAAQQVPLMLGRLAFTNIHEELVRAIGELDAALAG